MNRAQLDLDDLERDARRRADAPDLPLRFLPALRQLVVSINAEARLTADGVRSARASLVQALRTQLHLAALHRPVPARGEPLASVTVITGLHRTGTTLLQSLLAAHPAVRAPQLWELLSPASRQDAQALIDSATRYVEEYHRAAPGFAAIHPLHARRPEECHRLIANSFQSEIFGMRYRTPGYLDWLARQDHAAVYAFHREQLAAIVARRPGRHVVLKCPFHLWHADDLAAAYPQARVVRLHRDPVTTIGSVCSLTRTIRAARSAHVDLDEIGDFWLRRTTAAVGHLACRDAAAFAGLPVLDVRYPDLVADPVRIVRDVCAFVGLPYGADAERGTRRAVAANAHSGPGRHHYRLADYGLDERKVTRSFAGYRAAYQL